jgi:hypothetical protein
MTAKEVEGIARVQLQWVWSNARALNLNLWIHTFIKISDRGRSASALSACSDRPWDDSERCPSHADRRRAV